MIHWFVYTRSQPRWHIPTLSGSPRPACPEHLGDLIGKFRSRRKESPLTLTWISNPDPPTPRQFLLLANPFVL